MKKYEKQCQECGLIYELTEEVQEPYTCNFCKAQIENKRKAMKRHRKCMQVLQKRKEYYI